MYLIEIFFKRRKFVKIFDQAWKLIGDNIAASQHAEQGADPELELFYFVSVYYCVIYQAAVSAGMSTSSAHYLARVQTQKSKIDGPIVAAGQGVFSFPEDEKLKQYGCAVTRHIEPIVASVVSQQSTPDETEVTVSMGQLYQSFQQCAFIGEELFTAQA